MIYFGFSGRAVQTFHATSSLPGISQPTWIDGDSQLGSSPNTSTAGDNATILEYIDGQGTRITRLSISRPTATRCAAWRSAGTTAWMGIGGHPRRLVEQHHHRSACPAGVANANDLGISIIDGLNSTIGGGTGLGNLVSGNSVAGVAVPNGSSGNTSTSSAT